VGRLLITLLCLLAMAAGSGCTVLLGENEVPFEAPCDVGDRRCKESVRQVCNMHLEWEDVDECANALPVCTPQECLGVRQVAAGASHTCAVLTNDTVRCWGHNAHGELGDGTTISRDRPTEVPDLSDVASVALGGSDDEGFTCARMRDGTARCWGANGAAQLGSAADGPENVRPVEIPGLARVAQLSLGWKHACALSTSGEVSCWGQNTFSQAGAPGLKQEPTPVEALKGTIVEELAAGATHTCARTKAGVVCWGSNLTGQCGQSGAGLVYPPAPVAEIGSALRVAAGYYHSCATVPVPGKTGGVLRCWGRNDCGQLADGATCAAICDPGNKQSCSAVEPQTASFYPGDDLGLVDDVALGSFGGCLRQGFGLHRLYCWGRNDFVQAGTSFGTITDAGTPFVATPMPTPILRSEGVSSGAYHSCAIVDNAIGDSTVPEEAHVRDARCWGRNDNGQLGNGSTDTGQVVGVKWQ
jgi:alpha-tubulin suppressor-like RCC1 family protein